jgi:hypothetical protein
MFDLNLLLNYCFDAGWLVVDLRSATLGVVPLGY